MAFAGNLMNHFTTSQLNKEMDDARRIQMSLLSGEPPELFRGSLSGMSLPARLIGGDYFDYLMIDEERIRIVVGDVMGKGIPAAMLMTMLRGSFRTTASYAGGPGETLRKMNEALCDDLKALRSFATLFCADWNVRTNELSFANAGHNPPLYITENGISNLKAKGVMVGALPHQSYEQGSLTLACGEGVLFYTDGITEAENQAGEQFSKERLHSLLHDIKAFSSREIVSKILYSLAQFTNNKPQNDDITMIMLKN
ncbi:PP2C family protein-serine/threonine phosphatase [Salimicrobium flavidum]|uniref:PPM-type phosphatase domain-containing protein n=1 Tax=Salimicrobium flavidum TaxID=570947 RepID=A0A1N7J1L9_9BACI|nr:PP2C family protein-serine/threonine phosphatase [Salimicrobium flavidum]SIS43111.1 sigma-B regulation protein RsbU (phosphoserine phosphatase)/hypothetical protein [Salimicrobium flavidum]